MNIQAIMDSMSIILVAITAMCVLITIITEFTKEIGFLKNIPTRLQVLVLSLVVCTLTSLAVISYMNIQFMWYYMVAVVFASFIVAIITANGWDYFIEIVKRFYRGNVDIK